jgi:hypothetical protein
MKTKTCYSCRQRGLPSDHAYMSCKKRLEWVAYGVEPFRASELRQPKHDPERDYENDAYARRWE